MQTAKITCFIVLIISIAGCKSVQDSQPKTPDLETASTQISSPEILILNFYINSLDTIQITDILTNSGRLRNLESPIQSLNEGDLLITISNGSGNESLKTIVENPLIKKVEFLKDVESGELNSQILSITENSFFVRVQLEEWFSQIEIARMKDGNLTILKRFPFVKPDLR